VKLVREHIFEAFKDETDPIRDMGIGGMLYETLTPGTIIRPKKFVTMGRKSGKLVAYGKGIRLYPTYYLTVIQVYNMTARDRYFTCLMYGNIEDAQLTKKRLDQMTASALYSAINKVKLYIKRQSFNNHFEIIERGI